MKPSRQSRGGTALMLAFFVLGAGVVGLITACSTGGTPSVAAPPSIVTTTVTAATTIPTTSTVTVTVTQTPTSTSPAAVLVAATFEDPANYTCTDTTADWCWALDVTTTGPCPNGAYVALNVYKNDQQDVLTVLETTSAPITDPLGGKVTVQVGTHGLTGEGDTLKAALKEARCA